MTTVTTDMQDGVFVEWSNSDVRPPYEVGQLMHCVFDLDGDFVDGGYVIRSVEREGKGWKTTAVKWEGYPDNLEWYLNENGVAEVRFTNGDEIDYETWLLIDEQISERFAEDDQYAN